MKKLTFIASALLFTASQVLAQQEFKLAKSSGKLIINNISQLKVEGYDGKEIIFSTQGKKEKAEDPRAAGLSPLSSSGFDNTGIGLSITQKEGTASVSPIERGLKVSVKLPHGVSLSIAGNGSRKDSTVILLSNLKNEIDASTQYEGFNLSNVTGPVSLKTLYGNIEGKLVPSFKGPISLVSVYGFIDVTVPENAKADLSISSQHEKLYAAKELNLVLDEKPQKMRVMEGMPAATTVYGKGVQVITVDGHSTVTTTTTNEKSSKSSSHSASAVPPTPPTPPTPQAVGTAPDAPDAPSTVKKRVVGAGDSRFTFATPDVLVGTTWGGTVSGKLNGGGEKIVLKSTYGKIYLRK